MLDKRTQRQKHKERARVLLVVPDLFIDPNKKGVRAAPPRNLQNISRV
jgi:hypothetical protein